MKILNNNIPPTLKKEESNYVNYSHYYKQKTFSLCIIYAKTETKTQALLNLPFISSNLVCTLMLVSGGVGGGGGAGGVEDGVGVVVGVCDGVWSTWERVSPLATVEEGSGGGVGATFITDGRLLLVLSLFEGLSAAGKMI